ncbi:MAG: FixH family protein [Magnetococcales bacterium]|nr:FixH family protein [Magnetococcales bacterium]
MSSIPEENEQQHPKRRFEPWPTAIVLFFLVVFAANAVMVILGIDSWPGLVSNNHYEQGLAYNQVINAQKAQDKMGWQVQLHANNLQANQTGLLSLLLLDREGEPVKGAQVEGVLFRPLGEGSDITFLLLETEPGHYATTITPSKPGAWDVKISAKKTAKADFRYVERITVADQ